MSCKLLLVWAWRLILAPSIEMHIMLFPYTWKFIINDHYACEEKDQIEALKR